MHLGPLAAAAAAATAFLPAGFHCACAHEVPDQ